MVCLAPLHRWSHGIREEVTYLHEIFFSKSLLQREFDVGIRESSVLNYSMAKLHRVGPRQTDAFGADFAITIDITGAVERRKTALFQTKLADNCHTRVEKSQLLEARRQQNVYERSYLMAIDRSRLALRIESMGSLGGQFPENQATKGFDVSRWMSATEWITKWVECSTGPVSSAIDDVSIEDLLAPFILHQDEGFPSFAAPENLAQRGVADLPFVPADWHWLRIEIPQIVDDESDSLRVLKAASKVHRRRRGGLD